MPPSRLSGGVSSWQIGLRLSLVGALLVVVRFI